MAVGDWRSLLQRVVGRVRGALPSVRPRRAVSEPAEASVPPTTPAVHGDGAAAPHGAEAHEVVAVSRADHSVLVSWELAPGSIARARAVLGEDGRLAARVVLIAPDDDRVLRSDVREKTPVEATGRWRVADIPPACRCAVAIGLVGGGRFVSVAHARVVRCP
jgi:hypothetical protein